MDSQPTSIKGSIQIDMSLNRILYVFEKHVEKTESNVFPRIARKKSSVGQVTSAKILLS